MNNNIDKLTKLLIKYKNKFKYHHCAIYKKDFYYVDIICELKDKVPEKVEEAEKYINNIVKYNKYYDIGDNLYGKLIMILRKPYLHIDYDSDIFF
jgi:ribosome-associated translation inhibitor RaiA